MLIVFLFLIGRWSFAIPEVPSGGKDCWDLFVITNGTTSSIKAVSPSVSSGEDQFIGRLDLHQLGYWDRKKRKAGRLGQACILK